MDFNVAIEPRQEPVVPAVVDPMDPAPLIEGFKRFEKQVEDLIEQANALIVVDDESNSNAVEMIGQSKKIGNAIDVRRKSILEPYKFVTDEVNKCVMPIRDKLQKDIPATLENKIRPYLQKKEAERREAQRKADEEARRIQEEENRKAREESARLAEEARARAEAEGADKQAQEAAARQAAEEVAPPPIVVAASVPMETKTKTESATAKIETEWVWELEDVRLLPGDIIKARWNEIIKAIAPAVNPRIKAGIRSITGVRIFEQAKVQTRTRR